MEFLKRSLLKAGFLSITALMSFNMVLAQDYPALEKAFSNSYAFERQGFYSKAIDEIKAVYYEQSYEVNVRLGWLNYQSGLFTESMAYYQKAIALMPHSIEARLGLALPSSAMGNWALVIDQYRQILAMDPNNYTVNYRMGLIYFGHEDYDTALPYFEKIANMYPFDYNAVINYAWTDYYVGKLREAKVLFYKALLIKPEDQSARQGLTLIK